MAHHVTAKELRNMQLEDLKREIVEKQLIVAKMRIDVGMNVEKDTAAFAQEKKNLARLLTILRETQQHDRQKQKKLIKKPKTLTMSRP